MALSAPDIHSFALDLYGASWVKIVYLDDQDCPQQISTRKHGVRIGWNGHCQMAAIQPHDRRLKTVEVPLERVIFSTTYEIECSWCGDPECVDAEITALASWVIHNGMPYRLP